MPARGGAGDKEVGHVQTRDHQEQHRPDQNRQQCGTHRMNRVRMKRKRIEHGGRLAVVFELPSDGEPDRGNFLARLVNRDPWPHPPDDAKELLTARSSGDAG
jgi:hypothetical protein